MFSCHPTDAPHARVDQANLEPVKKVVCQFVVTDVELKNDYLFGITTSQKGIGEVRDSCINPVPKILNQNIIIIKQLIIIHICISSPKEQISAPRQLLKCSPVLPVQHHH